jgi:hypothetical protein
MAVDMSEVALLRLAAQRLAGPREPGVAEAASWMGAMQAQHYTGLLTSAALRTEGGTREAVEAAMEAGDVVRSWPMRGTLHVVAAEDLPWMLELMTPRVIAASAKRRAQLGLDEASVERAREAAVEALSGGRRLDRAAMLEVWDKAGQATKGGPGYHLISLLSMTGTLCFGPPAASGEQALVLLEEWIPSPRRLPREEALAEIARRYFHGHGPATLEDFKRWTGLTAGDARAGIAAAGDALESLEVDGVRYLMDPATPERLGACRDEARGVHLLPGFDEFVLGYADRSASLAPEHFERIVPGGNGVFRPTVVAGGRIVGTWKHVGSGARTRIEAEPFESFTAPVAEAIPQRYTALP